MDWTSDFVRSANFNPTLTFAPEHLSILIFHYLCMKTECAGFEIFGFHTSDLRLKF